MKTDFPDACPYDSENAAKKQAGEIKEKRIFIVEDESTIRELYKDMLGMQGFDVVTVESGEEGLQYWDDRSYDLIICDLGLPGMDGWEFISRIRKNNTRVPVIALTGWGDMISAREAEFHQVQQVIAKPVQLNQLIEVINNLLPCE